MARNEEKAQSLLNRWTTMKQSFADTFKGRRPYLASECENLKEAEHFRRQIIREISKKVSDIQNAGSGEHVIRDLNDQINKRIREKYHWEKRIIELGGPDYTKSVAAHDLYDADGGFGQGGGGGGYKYFGAARNLPGVRELFEKDQDTSHATRKTKEEMNRYISAGYYGSCEALGGDHDDDDDDELLALEQAEETRRVRRAIEEFDRAQALQQQQQRQLVGKSLS